MAPSSQFYSFLVSFLSVLLFSTVQADVTHQTNFRCTKICKDESARVAQVRFYFRPTIEIHSDQF